MEYVGGILVRIYFNEYNCFCDKNWIKKLQSSNQKQTDQIHDYTLIDNEIANIPDL